jgi:hypothetical protein
VGVGFSTGPIESAAPFDGLIGAGGEEEITVEFPAGSTSGSTLLHVNLTSALETPPGIDGWALGIAFDGDLDIHGFASVFPPPPASCPGSCPPPARVVDPAQNDGQRGIVAAVALSVMSPPEEPLPAVMTRSLFGIRIGWSDDPLPAGGRVATLRFQDGLVASGQSINNTLSVAGSSVDPCNIDIASVTVRFVEASATPFIRGNANGDRRVDIADAIWMLNDLFLGGPPTPCRDASDANGDGSLSITDPIFLLDSQFLGTRVPPAPFPGCGTDPSGLPGPLGCEASPCPQGS